MATQEIELKNIPKKDLPDEDEILQPLANVKILKYTDPQIERLLEEDEAEENAIDEEWKDVYNEDYLSFVKSMNNQYAGTMPRRAGAIFNVDGGMTKVKIDRIVGDAVKAITGTEPKVSVFPRPGYAEGNGVEATQAQEEFLDYVVDEKLTLDEELKKAAHSATTKRVGIIKMTHKVIKRERTRKETYRSKIVEKNDGQGNITRVNEGLERLQEAHSLRIEQEPEKYTPYINKLLKGEDASFEANYDEIIYNDPCLEYIEPQNFKVRKSVNGYQGLCDTELTIELRSFTWWELKALEKKFDFINVDKLLFEKDGDEKERPGARSETYTVKECVKYFRENPKSDEVKRIVYYKSDDTSRELFFGGIYYPWSVLDCYYFPFYSEIAGNGWFQGSVARSLTSAHIADNAVLNLFLDGVYKRNVLTPITPKNSDAAKQFTSQKWVDGVPINANKDDIDFVIYPPMDSNSMLAGKETVARIGSDVSRVSDLKTGGESKLDPNAPGIKTELLVGQSDAGISEYINTLAKGFNQLTTGILQMYYEISQNAQGYINRRIGDVTNVKDLFGTISRAQMIAKTSIQSLASTYNFDKLQELQTNLKFYEIFRPELMVADNPEQVHFLLTTLAKTFGQNWKNAINKILPSLQQLKNNQLQVAVQAVDTYFKAKQQEANTTGVLPDISADEIFAIIQEFQSKLVNAPSEEEIKAAKKEK